MILILRSAGLEEEDVEWVSPRQLRDAAGRLRQAIKEKRPEAKIILETYERNANGIDPVEEEFIQDLDDIEAIANWAEEEGAERMTLEVNWQGSEDLPTRDDAQHSPAVCLARTVSAKWHCLIPPPHRHRSHDDCRRPVIQGWVETQGQVTYADP